MNNKENKYYVYLHRDLNGVVFYIGKGTRDRFKSKQSRSGAWREIAAKGYSYQILKENMSNRDAMFLEKNLIAIYRSTVVNSKSVTITREMDFDFYNEYFYYDPTSPSGLRWKVARFRNKGGKWYEPGDVAGNQKFLKNRVPRCWRVSFQGKDLLVHRIIWVLQHGSIDTDLVVDHLDGNAFNNDISNLALKTYANNARNKRRLVNSNSIVGVQEHNNKDGTKQFRAGWIDENGKYRCKNFSIRKYGREEAFRLACEVRLKEIEKLRQLGFDYTDRHVLAQ